MSVELPPGQRVYAIGDIHGRIDLLHKMMDAIAADIAARPVDNVTEIFIGDYVDRGDDSKDVIDFLCLPPLDGRKRICLIGNHEDAMLSGLHDGSSIHRWLAFGAEATFRSYGIEPRQHARNPAALQPLLQSVMPPEHIAFLNGLKVSHSIGNVLFVHAGIRPGVPIDRQNRQDMIWIRDEFLSYRKPLPMHVVHGHTPVSAPEHLPWRTNVDTGAVYGGSLTAAVLEGNEVGFIQIPAR
ncbi:metallophosphoesterase family protein [Acuticoccus kandeliae]|uniref:metallophosphoesterase family protein n=1 Tax=Acuticoccus kandeliae TaxID=2073160 RepID=UPI00196B2C74|nr:metallophosphoesterase family protein [Acuticoccus kandeliae]